MIVVSALVYMTTTADDVWVCYRDELALTTSAFIDFLRSDRVDASNKHSYNTILFSQLGQSNGEQIGTEMDETS